MFDNWQYPKLFLLLLSFLLAYFLFQIGAFDAVKPVLTNLGYGSIFLGGLLFGFGFTSAFAIGIFVEMAADVNPFLAAALAGLGAMLMDLCLFELIRFEFFHEELQRLKATRFFQRVKAFMHHERISDRVREYLYWSIAGIIVASPLPDEIGVTLVSGLMEIDTKKFAVLCFILNSLGILAIFAVARAVQ